MDFTELAKKRFSVRKFDDRPIEDETLQAILEAGRLAPTAMNRQPQRIFVVRSKEGLKKIRHLTTCHYGAPVVLIFAYDTKDECHYLFEKGAHSGPQDVSIVATHVMLKATELGVGSVWVNMFSPTKAKRVMELPENIEPLLLMPLGYAAANAAPGPGHASRKALSETVKEL